MKMSDMALEALLLSVVLYIMHGVASTGSSLSKAPTWPQLVPFMSCGKIHEAYMCNRLTILSYLRILVL